VEMEPDLSARDQEPGAGLGLAEAVPDAAKVVGRAGDAGWGLARRRG
jgi:hypothetical protein